ncbi:MAG TPA: glycerol-3-phosphate 1-O-acyltransferase PlsY [Syntrophomonadaceae bacterium]|nr:glycerol-3-phosphate 1-O-acyltransferase PlsY [Syntrophomonadaceae bacterium]
MKEILIILICYLIGSIPVSLIVVKIFSGVDIRTIGSGNVGATNVLRALGIKGAIIALSGDLLKGVLAAWLGLLVGGPLVAAACAVIVVIGHCFPIFSGFKGGKGVATSSGAVLFLMPKIMLALLVIFIVIIILSRYVSLASITVAILLPILVLLFDGFNAYIVMSLIMTVIVVFQHRENIIRLRQGNESKIGQRA